MPSETLDADLVDKIDHALDHAKSSPVTIVSTLESTVTVVSAGTCTFETRLGHVGNAGSHNVAGSLLLKIGLKPPMPAEDLMYSEICNLFLDVVCSIFSTLRNLICVSSLTTV